MGLCQAFSHTQEIFLPFRLNAAKPHKYLANVRVFPAPCALNIVSSYEMLKIADLKAGNVLNL